MRYSTQFVARMDVAQTLNGVLLTMKFWPTYEREIGVTVLDAVAAANGIEVNEVKQSSASVVIVDTAWCS